MPTTRKCTIEAGDTTGLIDFLSTNQHSGALVTATMTPPTPAHPLGTIHVRTQVFTSSDSWETQEMEIDLLPAYEKDDGDSSEETEA